MKDKLYKCPYCGYKKVGLVLASYTCDNCNKRTSVYDEINRKLYKAINELEEECSTNNLQTNVIYKHVLESNIIGGGKSKNGR